MIFIIRNCAAFLDSKAEMYFRMQGTANWHLLAILWIKHIFSWDCTESKKKSTDAFTHSEWYPISSSNKSLILPLFLFSANKVKHVTITNMWIHTHLSQSGCHQFIPRDTHFIPFIMKAVLLFYCVCSSTPCNKIRLHIVLS